MNTIPLKSCECLECPGNGCLCGCRAAAMAGASCACNRACLCEGAEQGCLCS